MFTGLVEAVGRLVAVEERTSGRRLILCTSLADRMASGDSLAVNGCCLTVTSIGGKNEEGELSFDLLEETLSRTNLGALLPGSKVNLERPLAAEGRLGGHFVQGHIDTTAEVLGVSPRGTDLRLEVALSPETTSYVVPKGSLAVDGVSLTVAEVLADRLVLWIIPHTLAITTLGDLQQGQRVNLEFDILAKYVQRQMSMRI